MFEIAKFKKLTFFPASIIQTQRHLGPQSICLIVQLVHRWIPGNVSPALRLNLLDSLVEGENCVFL